MLIRQLRQRFGFRKMVSNIFNKEIERKDESGQVAVNYYQLSKELENLSANNKLIQKYMIEIYAEIKKTIDESYSNKNLQLVLKKVPSKHLCSFAVEQFIGSASKNNTRTLQ